MKSKPTARERFEKLKKVVDESKQDKYATRMTIPLFEMDFVISLVEAAIITSVAVGHDDADTEYVWKAINQRMAEGERKV